MRKHISIIVPYYKETESELFPLLASIRNQIGFDFSVVECILVNDGANNKLRPEFLSLFAPLEFRCIQLPKNRGPGMARQAGIDDATGDYLLFCDADDQLHNCLALLMLLMEVKKELDIVATEWLEEILNPELGAAYMPHTNDTTWMHGKLIRRQYLLDKDIRFHPDLRVHEDSYFLGLAFAMTNLFEFVPITTYVWKCNTNSITRRGNSVYTYAAHEAFINAYGKCFEVLAEKEPGVMQFKVVQFMVLNFFVLQQSHWKHPPANSYLKPIERAFRNMITPHLEHYRAIDRELFAKIYNEERAKKLDTVEEETFAAWLERVTAVS